MSDVLFANGPHLLLQSWFLATSGVSFCVGAVSGYFVGRRRCR